MEKGVGGRDGREERGGSGKHGGQGGEARLGMASPSSEEHAALRKTCNDIKLAAELVEEAIQLAGGRARFLKEPPEGGYGQKEIHEKSSLVEDRPPEASKF